MPPGFRLHGGGIQGSIRIAGLPSVYEHFPAATPNAELLAWRTRETAKLEIRYGRARTAERGTFAEDAQRYLRSVSALKDHSGRAYLIGLWVAIFGSRRRHTIRPDEIRAVRDAWLTVGPRRRYIKGRGWVDTAEPLAEQTVALRMRALENVWTVLDGRAEYNPVRDVPEPRSRASKPRALSYDVIEAILGAMPDRGQALRGKDRSPASKTKARLRLMAYTGLTASQVMALKPADFRLDPPAINRKARSKGQGAAGGWAPVPADAVEAMQAFAAADAWGTFSTSSMRTSFRRACTQLGLPMMTPYQLRHSFATAVVRQTGDLVAAQRLLQHASPATTAVYASDEIDPWLATAAAKVTGLRGRK